MAARVAFAGLLTLALAGAAASPAAGQTTKTGPSIATKPTGLPKVVVKRDNPCSVLLPSEVGQILGTPITMREVVDEVTCHFDYDKPERGGPPYLEMKVYFNDGKKAILATRMAAKLLGGDSGFQKLPGIGDEAWVGPMGSMLWFVKGSAGVEFDLRMVADGRRKGIRLAQLVAQRLTAAGF